MDGVSIADWLTRHSIAEAAENMRVSTQAVYRMIESDRNIRVIARDYDYLFIEIKELNR